jgi:hypothetical protein
VLPTSSANAVPSIQSECLERTWPT